MTSRDKHTVRRDAASAAGSGRVLREQAEALFWAQVGPSPKYPDAISSEEARRTSHELGVYQIELELQNEELQQSQVALNASQARYFDLYNLAPVGYCTLNEAGLIIDANLTAATLLGTARGALLRAPISRFIIEEDADSYFLLRQQLTASDGPLACELRMVKSDGTRFWAHLTTSATQGESEARVLRIVLSDIDERKRAAEALRKSEARFRSLYENATTGIAATDRAGQVIHFNEAFRSMLGHESETLKQMHIADFTFGEDVAGEAVLFAEILNGEREQYRIEKRYVSRDGRIIWVDLYVSTIRDESGEIVSLVGIVSDITERQESVRALAESRQQLRTLATHQEKMLERGRKHIALEVHDEMGKLLTALNLDLSLVALRYGDNRELLGMVDRMHLLVKKTVDVVRQVASNLRPAALDLGLAPAIEWLAEEFSGRGRVRCLLDVGGDEIKLDDVQSTAVFRVVQESLTNVARHAKAREVVISLRQSGQKLQVVIRDDGQGFDAVAVGKGSGFGLFGMRERMLALGGTLKIDSVPGKGTSVRIEIPLLNSEPA